MNIIFISSEVADIIKTGGLADVAKALPAQLKANGHNVRVIMPCYSLIKGVENFPVIGSSTLNPGTDRQIDYSIRQTFIADGLEVWLLDCPRYFNRTSIYGDNNQAYWDNGERFAFLASAALDACKALNFSPDIVHSNDWHAALSPMILRIKYNNDPFFDKTRSIITVHNGAFQGCFDRGQIYFIPEIGQVYNDFILQGTYINFLKCGVFYADKITTVSPGYAAELTTYLGGHGMTVNFQNRAGDLVGIINGCDYSDWDPSTDPHLEVRYNIDSLEQKALGKQLLQKELGLPIGDIPMYGMVARLTDQKGVGILIPILEEFLRHRIQVVIESTGDPALEHQMHEIAKRHPDKMVFRSVYDNTLAHRIEAASDFFLMPSIFEPCGLNQMYSLAYGTLPIVRGVGGLRDTVINYDDNPEQGNGFIFWDPNAGALLSCLRRTLIFYLEAPEEMKRLRHNAMRVRFSWADSCAKYEQLYADALTKPKWW